MTETFYFASFKVIFFFPVSILANPLLKLNLEGKLAKKSWVAGVPSQIEHRYLRDALNDFQKSELISCPVIHPPHFQVEPTKQYTTLHEAACSGSVTSVERLIESGCAVNEKPNDKVGIIEKVFKVYKNLN